MSAKVSYVDFFLSLERGWKGVESFCGETTSTRNCGTQFLEWLLRFIPNLHAGLKGWMFVVGPFSHWVRRALRRASRTLHVECVTRCRTLRLFDATTWDAMRDASSVVSQQALCQIDDVAPHTGTHVA